MDNKKTIGKRVQSYRKSLHIPRLEFCNRADISSHFLSEIETGKKGMSAETLYNICKAFDVDANYLLFGTERKTVITPLDSLIQQIPEQYSNLLEQSVEMLLETIRIAESCRQDNEKDI